MQWLNQLVEEIISRFPEGDLLIQSGASPSGTYHVGHLREVTTCDAIVLALKQKGRSASHVHFVDDLDGLRKIPVNIDEEYSKYLGMPLCDIPAPDGSYKSLADYFVSGLIESMNYLGIDYEIIYSHKKYREGFFTQSIEKCIDESRTIKELLEKISQRKLDDSWNPVQVMENGRLKNRQLKNLNKDDKTLGYVDNDGKTQTVKYDNGDVKLDWRLDWPARWSLLNVSAEPFGRDHATKGGSYDTGSEIVKEIFKSQPPIPVPYDFINRSGDTKKMSASKGTGISATEVIKVLPPEIVRFFILRYSPSKRLFFDPVDSVIKLVDEFAELSAKTAKTKDENQLLYLCTRGIDHKTISRVPFSHLVTSYQAALKDEDKTLEIIGRTEYGEIVSVEADIIKNELGFIDEWLKMWAPEDVKFELAQSVNKSDYSESQIKYFNNLAVVIETAPIDADGSWFHNAVYALKDESGLPMQEMFSGLYQLLINKKSGPRAGYFLSILPREWLIKRLKLED